MSDILKFATNCHAQVHMQTLRHILRRPNCRLSRQINMSPPTYLRCTVIMRPSSLGGGRIMRRTLSVRLSVHLTHVTERHVAPPSELQ